MPELGRRGRRLLLLAHVVVSVGWLGAGAGNLAMAAAALTGAPPGLTPHAAYLGIQWVDAWVVIPCAFLALATGVALSVLTRWGLLQHWWVLTKLVLTVVTIIASTFGIGVWVEVALADTVAGPETSVGGLIVGAAALNLVSFVLMTWLSIDRPRGLTPWAVREPRRSAQRPA